MARKAGTKTKGARRADAAEAAPAPKRAKAAKSSAPKAARATRKSAKAKDVALLPAVAATTSTRAKKALKSAKAQAKSLVPEAPSFPNLDIGATARTIGNQVVGALNTDVGRVLVAELLIYVAKSLTKAATDSEAGKDAKSALVNAGAKIGAAAADAGAKMVETGQSVAEAGTETAGRAADSASDLVRDVAQVAVSAVGGMVADATSTMMKRRGGRKPEAEREVGVASPGSGGTADPVDATSGRRPPRI